MIFANYMDARQMGDSAKVKMDPSFRWDDVGKDYELIKKDGWSVRSDLPRRSHRNADRLFSSIHFEACAGR